MKAYYKIKWNTFWRNLTNFGRPTKKDLYILLKFVRKVSRSIPEVWPHNFRSDEDVMRAAFDLNTDIDETIQQLSKYSKRKFHYVCNRECFKECKDEHNIKKYSTKKRP